GEEAEGDDVLADADRALAEDAVLDRHVTGRGPVVAAHGAVVIREEPRYDREDVPQGHLLDRGTAQVVPRPLHSGGTADVAPRKAAEHRPAEDADAATRRPDRRRRQRIA